MKAIARSYMLWPGLNDDIEACNASYPDIITIVIVTLNTPHNYDHVRFFILRVPTPDHGNTRTDDVINMLGTDRYIYADRHKAQAQSCHICQTVRNSPPVAPLHPWTWPKRVWQRLHIDFAEKNGNNFLVVIDSHSKWLEVKLMTSTISQRTIAVVRDLFSSYGLLEEVVSDNGHQFVSHDFSNFMKMNGIKHTLTRRIILHQTALQNVRCKS